jgi:thioredoxin reductase (NADPH)
MGCKAAIDADDYLESEAGAGTEAGEPATAESDD